LGVTVHARFRGELLDDDHFTTVTEAGVLIEEWRWTNHGRDVQGALGMATPA